MTAREDQLLQLLEQWRESSRQGSPHLPEQLCADTPELLADLQRLIAQAQQTPRQDDPASVWPETTPPQVPPACLHQEPDDTPATNLSPRTDPWNQKQAVPWKGFVLPGFTHPQVPGYDILGELGAGGMGIVYKARQAGLNRVVALKMIKDTSRAGPEELQRFRDEAEALARLQHPNIVQIFDIGEHAGLPYFSLEFCPGGSLDRSLKRSPRTPRETAFLIETLAGAIHAAHQAKIIHRDLKPANVLLSADEVPKITDFGLARKLDDVGQTELGAVMGTPGYMAPEQALGRPDLIGPLADVYALGALLYECLTGRPPFRGSNTYDILRQVLNDEPVPPSRHDPRCPRDLETICLKCLQKNPATRYESAQHLAEDVRRFLDGKPILARPTTRVERTLKWVRRAPFQAATVAAILALMVAIPLGLLAQVQAARKEVALGQFQLAERERLDGVINRVTGLYGIAQKAAEEASRYPAGDRRPVESWQVVEREATTALRLLDSEPELATFPLRESALELQEQARGHLLRARSAAQARLDLQGLKEHHADAVFFGSDYTGLDELDNLARARKAIASGLRLFGVTPSNAGVPVASKGVHSPAEIEQIRQLCHELLLLDAQALARPGEGEKAEQERLRQALARIDRAETLWPDRLVTRGGLLQRAYCLDALGEPEAAQQARQKAALTPVRLAADHLQAALERYHREEFGKAIEPLTTILRDQPGHLGAEYLLAVCRLRDRQYQAAREGLSRVLEQRPKFFWPRLLRGYAAMELQRWDEASADYEKVLQSVPEAMARYVALVNRGVLAMRRHDWDGARADLEKAIASRPDAVAAYLNLALVHRQRGETTPVQQSVLLLGRGGAFAALAVEARQRQARLEAVAVLDQAASRHPRSARVHHERGRLHLQLEQPRLARDDFQKAVGFAVGVGTLADDLIELGRLLYRDRDYESATRAYRTALKVRPDKALAWRLMAQPLLAQKRYQEATTALDRYLETIPVAPGRPPTLEQARTLAEVLKVRGLIHDEQARAHRARGVLHLLRRDLRSAIDSYTHALKLTRDPETLSFRGWAYLMFNAPELALADFAEALKIRPGDGNAWIGKASARVRLGEVREALADVEEGLRRGPGDTRMLYNAARVHALAVAKGVEGYVANRSLPMARAGERRAAELLRQVMERTPAAERAAFWKDFVQADQAFEAIRRGNAMTALAAGYERSRR